MKGLKEAAPAELDAITRRALRSRAMGRINETDCNLVISAVAAVEEVIDSIEERSAE